MSRYRTEGWNVIYTDKTYIHNSDTQPYQWSDERCKLLKKPISKRKMLIIVHAGEGNGFVSNGYLFLNQVSHI